MNAKNNQQKHISTEEKLKLFEKFKGSMKVGKEFDARKELVEALDERYGI